MKKILILFIFVPFFLDAGMQRFPTAPSTQRECEAHVYLERVLHRLNINQMQKYQLLRELEKSRRDNDVKTVNELSETLADCSALEQTMLLQARIGQGELQQEKRYLKRHRLK